eukprot:gene10800-16949_t
MATALSETLGGLLPSLSVTRARAAATQDKLAKLWPSEISLSSTPTKTLKSLCRKGIPAHLRASAWLYLSGGAAKRDANPDMYRELSASTSDLDESLLYAIEEDGRLGFNGNRFIASSKGFEAVNRMLFALVRHLSQKTGRPFVYAKGLAQLAAVILIEFDLSREADAFWTLVALIEDKLFPFSPANVAFGGKVEQGVLSHLVCRKMPNVASHLARLDLSLERLTSGWFPLLFINALPADKLVASHLARLDLSLERLTSGWFPLLFINALPAETSLRVLDAVMCEGGKVSQRVALALIKKYKAVIVGGSTSDLVMKVWKLRISLTFDSDELLEAAFSQTGSMPSTAIAKMRQVVLDQSTTSHAPSSCRTLTDMVHVYHHKNQSWVA